MAKRTLQDIAKELCERHPNASKMSIARKIEKMSGCSFNSARSAVGVVTGSVGDKKRKLKTVERRFGVAPEMPKSRACDWKTFNIVGDIETLILSDAHIPYHSELALGSSVEYGKKRKPDVVLLNGDWGDWYRCSRYTQDPTSRFPYLLDELAQQKTSLRWLRKQFPKARFIFKKGNHDERWDHWIWTRTPELSEMPELRLESRLGFDELGIEMVGEQRPVMLGKLPVFHGHELPKGMASPVNPARGVFMKLGTTGLIGHGHRTSTHAESDWKKEKELCCWSTGCLCDMTPEYARINKWNHGFAYVTQEKSGAFQVENLRINANGDVHQ
jgi:predicted phosphodiesterase